MAHKELEWKGTAAKPRPHSQCTRLIKTIQPHYQSAAAHPYAQALENIIVKAWKVTSSG